MAHGHDHNASLSAEASLQSSFGNMTLDNTLEDLSARFIVNLPAEELESMDRICFQIEQAHWYYEDFIRPTAHNPSLLPSFGLKAFSLLMFKSCPLLHDLIPNHQQIWTSFMAYKERVPVCGAVLISENWDKVLLVKGWAKGSAWSFPRGKINKKEPEAACAVREVLEETGYDLVDEFPPEQLQAGWTEREGTQRHPYYVELVIKEQKVRLYFIPGISEDAHFETRTRKEISKIDWFRLNDLPTWSKARKAKKGEDPQQATTKQPKFYMVTPFISQLKLWIEHNKPKKSQASIATGTTSRIPSSTTAQGSSVTSDDPSTRQTGRPGTDLSSASFVPRPFETAEEGTAALNAFFFGAQTPSQSVSQNVPADIIAQRDPSPLPDLATLHLASEATSTPPDIVYERQSSFAQPRPKPTSQQTSTLLALLANQNPTPTPPPVAATNSQEADRLDSRSQAQAGLLDVLSSASASQRRPAQGAHSTLFSGLAPPPEAAGFGTTHVPRSDERNASEQAEKRQALLRALMSVASGQTSQASAPNVSTSAVPQAHGPPPPASSFTSKSAFPTSPQATAASASQNKASPRPDLLSILNSPPPQQPSALASAAHTTGVMNGFASLPAAQRMDQFAPNASGLTLHSPQAQSRPQLPPLHALHAPPPPVPPNSFGYAPNQGGPVRPPVFHVQPTPPVPFPNGHTPMLHGQFPPRPIFPGPHLAFHGQGQPPPPLPPHAPMPPVMSPNMSAPPGPVTSAPASHPGLAPNAGSWSNPAQAFSPAAPTPPPVASKPNSAQLLSLFNS